MGFQDRQYYRSYQSYGPTGSGFGRAFGLPPLTMVVKYLLIINAVVFLLQMMGPGKLEPYFAAYGQPWKVAIQIWRLITFQFLHGHFWHFLFNMVVLYFFGTTLERTWGSRKFLAFYLTCGIVGGLVFVVASLAGLFGAYRLPLVGASGGLLGLMAACAILFPQMKVFVFPIPIPIPIRIIVFFVTVGYILNVLRMGTNAGGDLCHLGGMAAGFIWIFGQPYFAGFRRNYQQAARRRKTQQQVHEQYEIDRILAKVHEQGLGSLTSQEKQTLQRATEKQRRESHL